MRWIIVFLGAAGFVSIGSLGTTQADKSAADLPADLQEKLQHLIRITPTPQPLPQSTSLACGPPRPTAPKAHNRLVNKPDAAIHVYVSSDSLPVMMKRDSTPFPPGAVVLKQKFEDSSARKTVLYTGMLKREAGYNPDCGDWEFFTLSGDRRSITARGRLETCMACHRDYAHSDYVTKAYPIER